MILMAGYKPKIIKPVKPRKLESHTFPNGNNGGMNCAVPADRIRQDQSPDMLNMGYRRGTLEKRYGFALDHDTEYTNNPIRGLHFYNGTTDMMLTVCSGKLIIID